jgi:8-oxo-dGTP pyrophosphatase MutT (NUDIX family)
MFDLTELEISERLSAARQIPHGEDFSTGWMPASPRPAAVLIPLLRVSDAWYILFTRRTEKVADHKGQVAFPGGRADPGDPSPEFTALREAEEEIGLNSADARILGRLHELLTITNYYITPIVGVIPWPYSLRLAEIEVCRAFIIPLAWLADPAHHETRTRNISGLATPIPVIYFQPYDNELLWGVSAQITVNLLAALAS